jgi:hypothetical protein
VPARLAHFRKILRSPYSNNILLIQSFQAAYEFNGPGQMAGIYIGFSNAICPKAICLAGTLKPLECGPKFQSPLSR